MALIGKIREKSGLLVIVVGIALLAFILGDWQRITGVSEAQFGYGTVFGDIVDYTDYEEAVVKFRQQDQMQFSQQQKE